MKILLPLTVLLFISTTAIAGSDTIPDQKFYISTNLLKPLFKRYSLLLEGKITKHDALRLEFGYKYPRNVNYYENVTTIPFAITNSGTVTTRYYFSAGYARYFFEDVGFYAAADLAYIYSFYDDIYYHDCAGTSSDSYLYLESMYSNSIGIKPQAGFKLALNKGSKVIVFFDFYAGIGLYVQYKIETVYGENQGTCSGTDIIFYDTPQVDKIASPKILPFIGVNFGVGF